MSRLRRRKSREEKVVTTIENMCGVMVCSVFSEDAFR